MYTILLLGKLTVLSLAWNLVEADLTSDTTNSITPQSSTGYRISFPLNHSSLTQFEGFPRLLPYRRRLANEHAKLQPLPRTLIPSTFTCQQYRITPQTNTCPTFIRSPTLRWLSTSISAKTSQPAGVIAIWGSQTTIPHFSQRVLMHASRNAFVSTRSLFLQTLRTALDARG